MTRLLHTLPLNRLRSVPGPVWLAIGLAAMLLAGASIGTVALASSDGHPLTDAARPKFDDEDEDMVGVFNLDDDLDDDLDTDGHGEGLDSTPCPDTTPGPDTSPGPGSPSASASGSASAFAHVASNSGGGGSGSASPGGGDATTPGADTSPGDSPCATEPTNTPTPKHTAVPTNTPKAATNTPVPPTNTPVPTSQVLPTSVGPEPTVDPCKGYKMGDVNGPKAKPGDERRVNAIDAALVLQFDARLINRLNCPVNADVNLDGDINSIDAALILQKVAGLIDHLPVR